MRQIYKYQLPLRKPGMFMMAMPVVEKFLKLDWQNGHMCLWALHADTESQSVRKFLIAGTGYEIPPGFEYIGTWTDGPFIWHLFVDPK